MPKQAGPKRDKQEKNRIAALRAQKARKGWGSQRGNWGRSNPPDR